MTESEMNGAKLRFALEKIFGDTWRAEAPGWLGISESTMDRQINGHVPVAGPVAAAVTTKLELEAVRKPVRRASRAYRSRKKQEGAS